MDIQHLNVKFFVEHPEVVDLDPFLTIFNRWIQEQVCDDLLIDVADYRHVVAGPGVVLIGHQANYSLDNTDNRSGFLYNRKARLDGSVQDRLRQAVRSALLACRRLEEDPLLQGALRFSGQEVRVLINDRLIAPNTEAMLLALQPELHAFFDGLYGGAEYTISHPSDPRERFTVHVQASAPFDITTLLDAVNIP
ncbi:MAG: hypothetical protein HY710_05480 [Candidatus Latescibacteria bacterium]|nr:hypothetical protein [Candidatus Latescibacterota bacterium]